MKDSLKKNIFFLLAFSMSGVVILSNYLVQFPFRYFNLETVLTYGAFSYPIAFLITDLTNKTWKRASKKSCLFWILYWRYYFNNFINKTNRFNIL